MRKVLLQFDSDPHPSPFDAIAAIDSDVDVLLPYGGVGVDDIPGLVQSAMFPRGPTGLVNTAIWIGGSRVRDGEALLRATLDVFFDPFRLSVMHDSNGCNTTACAAITRVRSAVSLSGARAVVVGAGPVGLRAAELLRREGADVAICGLPSDLFGAGPYRRATGLTIAEQLGLPVIEPLSSPALREALDGARVVLCSAPAGLRVLAREAWEGIASIEVIVDISATEPVGVEGVAPGDDLAPRAGKLALGALAVGGPKMKLQRACVRRLFEAPGQLLDLDGVYDIALALG